MQKNFKIIIVLIIVAVSVLLYFGFHKKSEYFSLDVDDLSDTKVSQTVELKNGDTYDMTAEIVKKIVNGKETKMLAYNGMIPGPTIKVSQGSEITINFKNNTDVDTALHSHGVRLEDKYDGVIGIDQDAIKPGESFVYKIKFPDVGIYWYHPHFREDYAQPLGQYGAYIVEPANINYWDSVNMEAPLFVNDILMDKNGVVPFNKKSSDHIMMGRYGNVMLVNGEENYSLNVDKGSVARFYIINSSTARPFNIGINGVKMKLVGADNGAYENDTWVDSVILGPSERAIVEVLFDKSGTYELQNKTPNNIYSLGKIIVSDKNVDKSYSETFLKLRSHPETISSIDSFRLYFNKTPDKYLELTSGLRGAMGNMMSSGQHKMPDGTMMQNETMGEVMGLDNGIEWDNDSKMMNMMSDTGTDFFSWKIIDQETKKENMDINWVFKKDDKVKIRISNDGNITHPMQHPMHFHGNRFLVIDKNGIEEKNLAWKDTVLVPAGQYVDILLDASNAGNWMAHCHIAEHMEDGMMFTYSVK
ncbi:MAG: multicopper oxidase family protein [Patescibacteria group bacterium]